MSRKLTAALLKADAAAVAPTIALSLFALLAAGGIAFDYARMATVDTELQNAADQAALAAATQLDGGADAITRATTAAQGLVSNETLLANDGNAAGTAIGVPTLIFYESYDQDTDTFGAVTTDSTLARVVQVTVAGRQAFFALTPIVGAINSGTISASATAALGSSVCKVPPLMICNPDPGTPFNSDNKVGLGIKVVAHQGGQGWSPGNFGFLDAGQTNNGAPDLLAAMAYQDAALQCLSTETGDVDPGATTPAIDAANTRFDIYNFGTGSGSTLGQCHNGLCPAATNVTKDLVRPENANGNNACKLHNQGWQLPSKQFGPDAWNSGKDFTNPMAEVDQDGLVDAMGLPRDNCHYASYGQACSGGRIGDGKWARGDYFAKYHPSGQPANVSTITRYETYLWEIANGNMPQGASAGGSLRQQGAPVCSTGSVDPSRDRRLFTVAVADNCAALSGSSTTVQISEWVDMFFVEPAADRGNGTTKDEIYLEVVRQSTAAGSDSVGAQTILRSVPYLIR